MPHQSRFPCVHVSNDHHVQVLLCASPLFLVVRHRVVPLLPLVAVFNLHGDRCASSGSWWLRTRRDVQTTCVFLRQVETPRHLDGGHFGVGCLRRGQNCRRLCVYFSHKVKINNAQVLLLYLTVKIKTTCWYYTIRCLISFRYERFRKNFGKLCISVFVSQTTK